MYVFINRSKRDRYIEFLSIPVFVDFTDPNSETLYKIHLIKRNHDME